MAAAPRSSQQRHAGRKAARRPVRLADDGDAAVASPALESQTLLAEMWEAKTAYDAGPDKWSPRRTAAFLILTCGGFWTVVGLSLFHVFH